VLVQLADDGPPLEGLLSGQTAMPVCPVADGTPIRPDHVYVAPPDAAVTVAGGVLKLNPPQREVGRPWRAGHFFRSLAEDQGDNAVCVVLSDVGTEGSLGLEAIKEAGGMVLARSATQGGRLVDHVLPVEEMPARLIA